MPQPLANRLIRLAAFQNPDFYKAQSMRLPVWNKPRIIGCAENYPKHIGLPRGCQEELQHLLDENGINCALQQYAGRLHREHSHKSDIQIYDYYEHDHAQLARMWDKRLRGYKAMGYVSANKIRDPKAHNTEPGSNFTTN